MPIVRQVTANFYNDTTSPNTQTVDCTGVDTLIAVVENNQNVVGATNGATYNGVAMTEMGRINVAGSLYELVIYGIHNPATGSNTLSVTATSTATRFFVGAFGYSGTDTSAALTGRSQSNNAGTANPSITLGNAAGDAVVGITANNNLIATAGTGTTIVDSDGRTLMLVSDPEPASSANHQLNLTVGGSNYALLGVYIPALPPASDIGSIAGIAQADIDTMAGLVID